MRVFLMILFTVVLLLSLTNCQKKAGNMDADQLHKKVLTLDSHTDTALNLVRHEFDLSIDHAQIPSDDSRLDFPRMRRGGLDAVFFAAFIAQGQRDEAGHIAARDKTTAILQKIETEIAKRPQQALLVSTPAGARQTVVDGKLAIFRGIENGYAIGHDLGMLQKFFDLGVRYITLCHTANNDICDSSTDKDGPEHNGLSEFGRAVVGEMNRLGIIVDISHVSDKTVSDVLEISTVPVIASHSCARALCDNPRNINDELLKAIAAKGGVVQVCIFSDYLKTIQQSPEREAAVKDLRAKYENYAQLSEEEKNALRDLRREINRKYPKKMATVGDLVDHIDHIVQLVGIDHVGIGSDFDGGGGIEGCRDVSEMVNITRELVRRGYTEEQIAKIWSGNFLRVMAEVQAAAETQAS